MSALRLMTFNVQMLPLAVLTVEGISDDAEERAERVADAILSIPPDERPDVIAFNEVFNEDGRDRLKTRLASWPHLIEKLDNGQALEDAGLMLFSRFPFRQLQTGGTFFEHFYTEADDFDQLACKAVGIVRINHPVEFTTIAFTHMQASYDSEDEYAHIRESQLQEIHDALAQVMETDPSEWRNVILVGDINIRGDSGAQSDEWTRTFKTSGSPFQLAMLDGWRSWMHPPGDCGPLVICPDPDPGFTNIDLATGKRQRLDYHCFSMPGVPSTGLVAHHMSIRFRDLSDHFSLEAVIQRWSPHCTPSDAFELLDIDPLPGLNGTTQTSLRRVDLDFQDIGAFQWIYVRKPGTFTVFGTPGLRTRLFLETDLTNAVTPADTLSVSELPPDEQGTLGRRDIDPEGTTLAARLPFFIAVETDAVDPGPATLFILEHLGDTPATALWLHPHQETMSTFPVGQPLGVDDLCWFKARFGMTFAGASRPESFRFLNDTGTFIEVTELDTALNPLNSASGTEPQLELVVDTAGDELRLFSIARSSVNEAGYRCFWFSPVSYIALDQPAGFYVSDESGPDIFGDDEIRLNIAVDGADLFQGAWDSADTGERWPGLVETFRNRLTAILPGARRIPFADVVFLEYTEEDMAAAGWKVEMLNPLAQGEPASVDRRLTLPISDSLSDGSYTFYCTITRHPE